jgi:polyamine oxidase
VRTALDLAGWIPQTYVEQAVEFCKRKCCNGIANPKYQPPYMFSHFPDSFDWEFAENPDVSSNFYAYVNDDSYDGNFGPNSDGNNFVIDQRGFKYIFLQEANQFLKKNDPRLLLNTTVKNIKYTNSGVVVTAKDGSTIEADYAISTFRYIIQLEPF